MKDETANRIAAHGTECGSKEFYRREEYDLGHRVVTEVRYICKKCQYVITEEQEVPEHLIEPQRKSA